MLDLTPFLNTWFYPALALLLAGFAAWLMTRTSTWLDAHAKFLDANAREKIATLEEQAISAGVDMVMAQIKHIGGTIHPTIDNPIVRFAAQTAINHAGGILADHGADPDEIAAKILAKLPDNIVTTDTTGVTIQTTTVTTTPLGDIKQ